MRIRREATRSGRPRLRARDLTVFIAALFMVGSTCFAVGVPLSFAFEPIVAGIVFFVGSLFFTTAAGMAVVQCVDEVGDDEPAPFRQVVRQFWQPERLEWWSDITQFPGTILFNANTFRYAFATGLSITLQNRLIWVPDAVGSALFLASGVLACLALHRDPDRVPARDRDWWGAAWNLAGCIGFAFAAIGAYVLDSGDLVDPRWANVGTCLGALCFLVGSRLMMPRSARHRRLAAPAA